MPAPTIDAAVPIAARPAPDAAAVPVPPPPRTCAFAPPPDISGLDEDALACASLVLAAGRDVPGLADLGAAQPGPCATTDIDQTEPRDHTVHHYDKAGRTTGTTTTHAKHANIEDEYVTVMAISYNRAGHIVEHRDDTTQYLMPQREADCTNTRIRTHTVDKRGRPTRTKTVIDTCEGVDAGTTLERRKYRGGKGHDRAIVTRTDVRADGNRRLPTRRELYVPGYVDPRIVVTCEHNEACACEYHLTDCHGNEVARLSATAGYPDAVSIERHDFACWTAP